jgi:hypothetical protein
MDYYRNSGDDCQTTAIVGVVACAVESESPWLGGTKPACVGSGAVGVKPLG